jgi:hypothetical protein
MATFQNLCSFYVKQDLSGDDILQLTHKEPIIYSELKNYTSVEQLLGKHGYAVILYETSSKTTGHWVCISKTFEEKLRFFDSYGLKYDAEDQYAAVNNTLPRYLTNLIESSKYNVEWNTVDYQKKSSAVSTCGRWASVACLVFRHMRLSEIETFLKSNSNSFLSPDNIVTSLTMLTLHEIRNFFDKSQ